jgi:His-Xaa-Ser system radical SAM maturase HxsC
MRVLSVDQIPTSWLPDRRFLVRVRTPEEVEAFHRLEEAGLENLVPLASEWKLLGNTSGPFVLESGTDILEAWDVVAVTPGTSKVQVLYRRSDAHHTVFLTNRCNSYCLMCSQPPTVQDDSWLVDEATEVARHIEGSPPVIGFTGGEPLLLGPRLREVLDVYLSSHPECHIEVLSNGRLFSDSDLASKILTSLPQRVTWMIPLYGHAAFLHDYVVQSPGAFEETLEGLFALHENSQPIQLRIVLIRPVLLQLEQLCTYISRNLPFVKEVALIGCESIGLALANRDETEVNMLDWHAELISGIRALVRSGLHPVLMNLPLCVLPESARRYAHRSISDWKRVFAEQCASCGEKEDCCGLFAWHKKGWMPAPIAALGGATK